jgi:hypothetical protein
MYEQMAEILDELVQAIAASSPEAADECLTTHFPMKGRAYSRELMVVGRAVNGDKTCWKPNEAQSPEWRSQRIDEWIKKGTSDERCPLEWVGRAWGRIEQGKRNSKMSAFWRVVGEVSRSLTGNAENWWSHLVWSNLYKVAPSKGWNPSSGLRRTQKPFCKKHLAEEFRLWKPKRILFLTGWNWARSFIRSVGNPIRTEVEGLVQWAGNLEFPDGTLSQVVVCVHPMGKPEDQLVREVLNSFATT